ncbi:antifreeze protein [Sedimentitalea sp. HM32M-2]|uniref:antifreeze protein n=1 Tax=Sedimentitalea sp. HM32M-2 TaxID=3351566 RepID=UPI0036D22F9B
MTMRILGLTGAWSVPESESGDMIQEKAPAFTEALVAGTLTALSGRGPDRVMKAIVEPISEKASANRVRLTDYGPRFFGNPNSTMSSY